MNRMHTSKIFERHRPGALFEVHRALVAATDGASRKELWLCRLVQTVTVQLW